MKKKHIEVARQFCELLADDQYVALWNAYAADREYGEGSIEANTPMAWSEQYGGAADPYEIAQLVCDGEVSMADKWVTFRDATVPMTFDCPKSAKNSPAAIRDELGNKRKNPLFKMDWSDFLDCAVSAGLRTYALEDAFVAIDDAEHESSVMDWEFNDFYND